MKRILFFLVLITVSGILFAQQDTRGIGVINNQTRAKGKTRAVVVGISVYRNLAKEKQLEFADKDAELFNDYLQTAHVVSESLLITNQEAKANYVLLNIDAYLKKSTTGDNLIIYFAGHGDVSKDKTKDQDDAYLLCTDVSTDADYSISDAISLSSLQIIIADAAKRGVSVTLVTDACHSGKVASSQEAALSTVSLIVKEWDKVIKLASCQTNELSYENKKWGNGHGVFTYYLVRGLSKEADNSPRDSLVNLREIGMYMDKMVPEATDFSQNPIKIGGDARYVFAKSLSFDYMDKDGVFPPLKTLLAARDQSKSIIFNNEKLDAIYFQFKNNIKNGLLTDSAFTDYNDFVQAATKSQSELVKNELIIELLSSAQKVLDKYLEGGNNMPSASAFSKASSQFDLAIKLYQRNNAISKQWNSKMLFLKAYAYIIQQRFEKYSEVIELLNKAKKGNKKSAYINQAFGRLYNDLEDYELSEKYLLKAIELAPRWTYPKSDLGNTYFDMGRWNDSKNQFLEALKLDSNLARIYNNLSQIYLDQGKLSKSEQLFLKADSLVPNISYCLGNLGVVYLEQGRLKDAEAMFARSLKADSNYYYTYKNLGRFYLNESKDLNKADKALKYLEKAREIQPFYYEIYNSLGDYYTNYSGDKKFADKADSLFKVAIALNAHNRYGYYSLAYLKLKNEKDTSEAKRVIHKMMHKNRGAADAYYYAALFEVSLKQYEKAKKNYAKALQLNPFARYAYYDYAELLEKTGKLTQAEDLLLKIPKIFEESPEDNYKIGNFYLRIGNQNKAIEYFNLALKYDSSYSYAWSSLAYAKLNFTNDVYSAKMAFLKAKAFNPYKHDPKIFSNLINNKAQSLNVDSTSSGILIDYYNAAKELNPDKSNELNSALSQLYYLANDLENTKKYLNEIDGKLSDNLKSSLRFLRWKIYLQEGDLEKAKQLINQEMEEDVFPSHIGNAIYYYLKGDILKAKEEIRIEIKENPSLLKSEYLNKNYNSYLKNIIERLLK